MTCKPHGTHHHACDCREAKFRDELEAVKTHHRFDLEQFRKCQDENKRYREALDAVKVIDDLLCLSDRIYDIREREGEGWEGPKVKAYSDALTKYKAALDGGKA